MNPLTPVPTPTIITVDLGTSISQVQYLIQWVITTIPVVVTAASAASALFKKQEGIVGKIQDFINLFAINVGYAKNAAPIAPTQTPTA